MDEWPGVAGPRVLPAYGRERASEGGLEDPRLRAVVSPFAKGARLRLLKTKPWGTARGLRFEQYRSLIQI